MSVSTERSRARMFWLVLSLLVLFVAYWLPTWDAWSDEKLMRGAWYLGLLAHARMSIDFARRKD